MVEGVAGCAGCARLQGQLEEQGARLEEQERQLEALRATVKQLEEKLARAQKDSSTSSKPPSSDLVKPPPPPPPEGQAKRCIGGQPGHPKHERPAFPPEQVNEFFEHTLQGCPCCGRQLRRNGDLVRIIQQVDVRPAELYIEQHNCPEYWCSHCQKSYQADPPQYISQGGLVGPRLTLLIAYLKGVCHASFSTIRLFIRDVLRLSISRGQLSKVIGKVCCALDGPYRELLEALPGQAILNVDETGHNNNGQRMWTWCFRASLFTLFKIDPTRSADVLVEVLGEEFDGVLGCDYYSAYRRFMREFGVSVQFCLAHLIRDVKSLLTLPCAEVQAYGERLREALKNLFRVIHEKADCSPVVLRVSLELARQKVLLAASQRVPLNQHCQNLANRFAKHGAAYFEFITTPGVEPTNNLAEQAIRFVVIDRHITQGTRSEGGQRWCERIWSVIASCAQQGRSVFDYLGSVVMAHFHGWEVPSLLPAGAPG
jgi:transposase